MKIPLRSYHTWVGITLCLTMLVSSTAAFSLAGARLMRQPATKTLLIAHRGASAYAPEHTLAAYQLAIEQGADFVEQDLQVTKDGVLVCLHDADLARTTNASELFPDRATNRDPDGSGREHRGWYVADFTLAEIKRLDAGSWFNRNNAFAANPKFAGERVPTLAETIKFIGNRAGLYIEIKHFDFYRSLGHDIAAKLADELQKAGFNHRGRESRIFIQSFSKACLLHLRDRAPRYPRVQLLPMEDQGRRSETATITPELAKEIAAYAAGAGPSKTMITSAAEVALLHAAKLLVHPYTFRGSTSAALRHPLETVQANGATLRETIIADIEHFLAFGIDGGFTDYPDLWKATRPPAATK